MNGIVTDENFELAFKTQSAINVAVSGSSAERKGATFFTTVLSERDLKTTSARNIYVPNIILTEEFLNELTDYAYENDSRLLIRAASTLEEVGLCDVKFGLSPIMLLHKCGILNRCAIVGGAYLDKDDMRLIAQENSSVILTPTFDAGYGFGVANAAALFAIKVKTNLGTMDGKYNQSHDLSKEAFFLRLSTNCAMKKENAVPEKFYQDMIESAENNN